MSRRSTPRVLTIPPGAPFLDTLVGALLDGSLLPGHRYDPDDPAAMAETTIYVPTRRAARALRGLIVDRNGGRPAILPTIRPLGDFDEDGALFEEEPASSLSLPPPIGSLERIMRLAPLVQAWKRRLPAHIASLIGEEVIVPASVSDAIWLARDLATLMDEFETAGLGWDRLGSLVDADLAGWWQVTLEFLEIVTRHWPDHLSASGRSNPAVHRMLSIDAETARLTTRSPSDPVIAAGSTGSIPATSRLLAAIARLPNGAVVLPGLDQGMDEPSWSLIGGEDAAPSTFGHPQYTLKQLLRVLGVSRDEVIAIGRPPSSIAARSMLIAEALRPAETTELWRDNAPSVRTAVEAGALDAVTLIDAANEREEAAAIAAALRLAAGEPGAHAALVTPDRALARRVAAELQRYGVLADDSAGLPLASTPPATLLRLLCEAVIRPGDPLGILALLKHPLLSAGLPRPRMREAAETIELVALRGGTGRPDLATLDRLFADRLEALADRHPPFWAGRLTVGMIEGATLAAQSVARAVAPLAVLRGEDRAPFTLLMRATIQVLEALGRSDDRSLSRLYGGDAGETLASFLRESLTTDSDMAIDVAEWPDVIGALIATEVVKPKAAGDPRISIWGTLEARLQSPQTVVLAGLNEGTWPRQPPAERFLSRFMRLGVALEPPERRLGQSAHDFVMAAGAPRLVLSRSARTGDAPGVPSRWLQRLSTVAGAAAVDAMKARGTAIIRAARALDEGDDVPFAARPCPTPPLSARPRHFGITEIETLRRDPYAVYARRVLKLRALDPLLRDPGAAERGTLIHEILQRFVDEIADPFLADAEQRLMEIARQCFKAAALPVDVETVWWPRVLALCPRLVAWERERAGNLLARHAETSARPIEIGMTGVTISGKADRIDILPAGLADIIDYKTGASPSLKQARTLLAPQLALEGALLSKGAFEPEHGPPLEGLVPADLLFVRIKPNGEVDPESVPKDMSAAELSADAWRRLEGLVSAYANERRGYLSRAMPFRERETDGEYDHLARVAEWSAGADAGEGDAGE